MKCNKGTKLVCTSYEKCSNAVTCKNVPKGIKEKLKDRQQAFINLLYSKS